MTVLAPNYEEMVLEILREHLKDVHGVSHVVMRLLNMHDKTQTLGITLNEWVPDEYEIAGGFHEPSLSHYEFTLGHVVKHKDEATGLKIHREVAKYLRMGLYQNADLQLALRSIVNVSHDGFRTERTHLIRVTRQQLDNNDINQEHWFLSATQLRIDTTTTSSA